MMVGEQRTGIQPTPFLGVSQCTLALNILCRKETYTTTRSLAIFHVCCFLRNIDYTQERLVVLQIPSENVGLGLLGITL